MEVTDLYTGDDGLWQDGLQDVHGLRVVLQNTLDNGLHPGGVSFHPQLGRDTRQQLPLLHRLAAPVSKRWHPIMLAC